jgi:hypothetical protein
MAILAKFFVQSIELFQWGTTVKLSAVTKGQDDAEFWAATPNGSIQMTIKNELAAAQFKPGQEFLVTFEQA